MRANQMAELKTKVNDASVEKFLHTVKEDERKKECFHLLTLFEEVTKEKPKMWGASIIGYGSYHYKYATGREGDWMKTGFSPRKQNLTIYIMPNLLRYEKLLSKLGKFTTGVSCIYVKKLEDINLTVLKKLIKTAGDDISKLSK